MRFSASPPYGLHLYNQQIPAKSNQEIRGTFKHNKKGLKESLNHLDLLRTLQGIYGQNLMLSALMVGGGGHKPRTRTVLDNVSTKCHAINY